MRFLLALLMLYIPGPQKFNDTVYVDKVEKNTVVYADGRDNNSPRLVQWLFYEENEEKELVVCGWDVYKEESDFLRANDKELVMYSRDEKVKIIKFRWYTETTTNYDKEVMLREGTLSKHPYYWINTWLSK